MVTERIEVALQPVHLDVINESQGHSAPAEAESHFKVVVVSASFDGMLPVMRHRAIYKALGEGMEAIHALSIETLTPQEWADRGGETRESPPCSH